MLGLLFLFVPVALWLWGKPIADDPDREFWSLVQWNLQR